MFLVGVLGVVRGRDEPGGGVGMSAGMGFVFFYGLRDEKRPGAPEEGGVGGFLGVSRWRNGVGRARVRVKSEGSGLSREGGGWGACKNGLIACFWGSVGRQFGMAAGGGGIPGAFYVRVYRGFRTSHSLTSRKKEREIALIWNVEHGSIAANPERAVCPSFYRSLFRTGRAI